MSQQHPEADFLIGPFGINLSDGRVYGGRVPLPGEGIILTCVPVEFLTTVVNEVADLRTQVDLLTAELADAQQPRPIEQALAVLAQAWQSAVRPAGPERVAVPDALLEARRSSWDAFNAACPSTDNPWSEDTPLGQALRDGWYACMNDEVKP